MPDCLDWYVWRLVLREVAPYADLRDRWSIGEMAAAHLALDIREDVETLAYER